ncbi:50S ribosomal protein L11 methyltransferase [Ralstonia mannitolilytica]|uniref:Ribosomal protein L11 methyltransferase n=1 Tax=Ralstonia mannitolilytica TaxID=105219 RepID=A0AAD2AQE3_9RALS|nr:50S ribosomal protein L11 methyltransferase [Ralstonia mannitolilytica]MBY4720474.1 50S ribosomal protein L11 methyltransferase [Ralstonia mannitolilytica]CAJ0685866.1 Ribosomal protein L11 methyltransferase [Ralstonia mannitolilytica]CAJ0702838.1 Ribosomal protein L11 methyltransferase [Ralstonia mannitolilytica]CAJ0710936.1 Ribosomal protein L11 methyltransferase [Ralstonia mannitolilytica]CAJ0848664.1 Ribosomal protein L11 methyltransferase [Ralstonia mannitolilytica]
MTYRECVLEVARDDAEALSEALFDLGALSVSVEDADADTPDEEPLFGEPGHEPTRLAWNRSRVVALLADDADPALLVAAAANEIGLSPLPQYTVRDVEEQDWVRVTQSQFEPIHIGERIWVVPSWHDAPEPDAVVLELDPGLAFGTGSHPTTRLCMEWLEQHMQPQERTLDYGCGSGILAIVARKLGAGETVGVDIDPNAVDASRYNAERNHVEATFALPDDAPEGTFDLVVANILSNPLKLMAAMLCARVRPGGRLVLSGVLERQAEEVAAAYASAIPLTVWRARDGWVCLHGVKPA